MSPETRHSTPFTPENIYLDDATGRWYHDGTDVSDRPVRWRCEAGHSFSASIAERIAGLGCPTCPTCVGCPTCATDDSTPFTPENIYLDDATGRWYHDGTDVSDRPVWWRCEAGHSFSASIAERIAGLGCPTCPTTDAPSG